MKEEIRKRVFVTKYALTEGVFEMDARIVEGKYASRGSWWIGPNDWHETKEAATKRTHEMIAAKRKSMAKAEAKLAKMERALANGMLEIKTR